MEMLTEVMSIMLLNKNPQKFADKVDSYGSGLPHPSTLKRTRKKSESSSSLGIKPHLTAEELAKKREQKAEAKRKKAVEKLNEYAENQHQMM